MKEIKQLGYYAKWLMYSRAGYKSCPEGVWKKGHWTPSKREASGGGKTYQDAKGYAHCRQLIINAHEGADVPDDAFWVCFPDKVRR